MTDIQNSLKNITKMITSHLEEIKFYDYGLLGGNLGEVMFLYLQSRIDSDLNIVADYMLDNILKTLKSPSLNSSYCNGLAGLGIGLNFLESEGFLEDTGYAMSDFDTYIAYCLDIDLTNDNIDFLHGFVGIGFYFLMRAKKNPKFSLVQLKKILEYLYNKQINNGTCIKWGIGNSKHYNISLSHGIASVNLLLTKMLTLNISADDKKKIVHLLNGSTQYLMENRIDFYKNGSCFPMFPTEESSTPMKSRLAWCYGDLGISYSLWKTADTLGNNTLRDTAIEYLKLNAKYRTKRIENMVFDAGICHGTAGIAIIYQYFFRKTNLELFEKAYIHWLQETLSLYTTSPEYISFNNLEQKWEKKYSILEGLSGIGLFFQSIILNDWKWIKFLLLF